MWFGVNTLKSSLNRTEFDELVKKELLNLTKEKKKLPTISAIYRVKNGETSLELSIKSIAPICSEIIIVNNKSSDRTNNIVNKIKQDLKDICDIRLVDYEYDVSIAGNDYLQEQSDKTLADFYNYSFSQGTCDYLWKVDAHYIFTFNGLLNIVKKIKKRPRFIIFRGCETFGKRMSYEMFLFKNDSHFKYIDGERYEELLLDYQPSRFELIKNRIFQPVYVHVKRISYISLLKSENVIKELYK